MLYPFNYGGILYVRTLNMLGRATYYFVAEPLCMSYVVCSSIATLCDSNSYDGGTNHQRPQTPFPFVPEAGLEPARTLLFIGF